MNKIKISIACLALGITWNSSMNAQVGFNNPAPDASSVIDVKATDKGILVPRMNTAQRNAMLVASTQPANGLLVFDTDLNRFYLCYNNGTIKKWLAVNPWVTDDEGGTPTPLKDMYTLVTGNTGVATSSPKSKLAVNGNFAVGSNYAGNNAAPVNGAIIEGNVGIGKNTAATALDVNGTVTATNYALTGSNTNGPVPKGGIIMWSGSIGTIPTGWALCDGANGTPDLRERFIVGSGGNNASVPGTGYAVGNTGGEVTHTLTISEIPSHNHGGSTSIDGAHTHNYNDYYRTTSDICASEGCGNGTGNDGLNNPVRTTASDGDHSHTINAEGGNVAHENRPPFYALAFIMKL
jgi:microcystin-dependent protein